MKYLFLITFLIFGYSQLFAAPVVIRNKNYIGISNGLYKDIQIDSNSDGKADLRYLEDGSLKIFIEYNNSQEITLVRETDQRKIIISISQRGQKITVKRATESIPKILYYERGECSTTKSLLEKIDELRKVASTSGYEIQTLVDESCDQFMSGDLGRNLLSAVKSAISDKGNALLKCLSSDSFQRSLDISTKEHMNLLSAKMELNFLEIVQNQETQKPLFFCGEDTGIPESKGAFKGGNASYKAGKILINFKKGADIDEKTLRNVLQHEYLHYSGEENEKTVSSIVSACENKSAFVFSKEDGDNNKGINPAGTKLNAETINAKEDPVGMKAAAETIQAAPTQAESSTINMARVIDNAGESKALEVSRNQTSGIFAAANNLMGMMQTTAVASPSGTSGNTPSSSRSIASTTTPTNYKIKEKTPNAGRAGQGETVVENIEINQNRVAASPKREGKTEPSSRKSNSTSIDNTNPEIADSKGAQAGTGFSTRSTAPSNSSSSSATKGVRRPSNASVGGRSDGPDSDSNQYVTYLTKNSYSQTKQKLRDPKFVKKLKDASISIIDLKGGVIGASRGNVILLDQGDRFVPQN